MMSFCRRMNRAFNTEIFVMYDQMKILKGCMQLHCRIEKIREDFDCIRGIAELCRTNYDLDDIEESQILEIIHLCEVRAVLSVPTHESGCDSWIDYDVRLSDEIDRLQTVATRIGRVVEWIFSLPPTRAKFGKEIEDMMMYGAHARIHATWI